VYGEMLAREYGDPAYFRVHQLTVDTYAVQHPGPRERRAIQSVGWARDVWAAWGQHHETVRGWVERWLRPPV
jgi:hypothetical protein